MRLFPNDEETSLLEAWFSHYRWYYNSAVKIMEDFIDVFQGKDGEETSLEERGKYSSIRVREFIRHFKYTEEKQEKVTLAYYEYDPGHQKGPVPEWEVDGHNRIARGAFHRYTSGLNSALSNLRGGHNKGFKMKLRSRKQQDGFLYFEDACFPAKIKKIKSRYGYSTRDRKRKSMSFSSIFSSEKNGGISLVREKDTGRWYLYYPVSQGWFPDDDKRSENQVVLKRRKEAVISLDPGVRKFQTGYDPQGNLLFFGEGVNKRLIEKFHELDELEEEKAEEQDAERIKEIDERRRDIWARVKGWVDDLHWKVAKYLVVNYDVILLPDFRVQQLQRKCKSRVVNRLLGQLGFWLFRSRLQYKCQQYGRRLIVVDESYTSKTCTVCGCLNALGGEEVFRCEGCGLRVDRDVNGCRNIFIKNVGLSLG